MKDSEILSCINEFLRRKGEAGEGEARRVLLEEIKSEDLRPPLLYVLENWGDKLRPALVTLGHEAVGGQSEAVTLLAAAATLVALCFYIWDDMVDRTKFRLFKPTMPGKFGEEIALIMGGLIMARAFCVLPQLEISLEKRQRISRLFMDLYLKMAESETTSAKLKQQRNLRPEDKFQVLKMRAIGTEFCLKVGAILGPSSENEVEHLGKFGTYLGTILHLIDDLIEALNLTVELEDKIKSGSFPYVMMLAQKCSEKVRYLLSALMEKETIEPADIKRIVECLFESGAIGQLGEIIKELIGKATSELSYIRDSEAKHQLRFLVDAQHPLFLNVLSAFQPS